MTTRRIAIFGRKGGGVSTVTDNIAEALEKSGHATRVNVGPLSIGEENRGGTNSAECEFVLYDLGESSIELAEILGRYELDHLFAVSSADRASLATVNSMLRLTTTLATSRRPPVSLIGNRLPATYADCLLDDFARSTGISVALYIPHSINVWRSAFSGETVVSAAPRSHLARLYRQLAQGIVDRRLEQAGTALALDDATFDEWSSDWGDRLFDYADGFVRGGEAI